MLAEKEMRRVCNLMGHKTLDGSRTSTKVILSICGGVQGIKGIVAIVHL